MITVRLLINGLILSVIISCLSLSGNDIFYFVDLANKYLVTIDSFSTISNLISGTSAIRYHGLEALGAVNSFTWPLAVPAIISWYYQAVFLGCLIFLKKIFF